MCGTSLKTIKTNWITSTGGLFLDINVAFNKKANQMILKIKQENLARQLYQSEWQNIKHQDKQIGDAEGRSGGVGNDAQNTSSLGGNWELCNIYIYIYR